MSGSFGKNCIERCRSNCISCNAVNGVCDLGCSVGWKGTFCEHGKFSRDWQKEIASEIWFKSSILYHLVYTVYYSEPNGEKKKNNRSKMGFTVILSTVQFKESIKSRSNTCSFIQKKYNLDTTCEVP